MLQKMEIIKLENKIGEIINSLDGYNSREEMKEEENKISEFEDRSIEFTHSKQRREKQMNRTSGICGKIAKDTKLILQSCRRRKRVGLKEHSKKNLAKEILNLAKDINPQI